jgi:poly [ADP-ribose] polymerase
MRRLDAAICKDEKIATAATATEVADGYGVAIDGVLVDGKGNGGNNKKRKMFGDGDEEGNGDTSIDLAKLEGMSYRELQGLAKARGLTANGGKKDVIQRLLSATADPAAIADGGPQGEKEVIKGLQFYRSICFFMYFSPGLGCSTYAHSFKVRLQFVPVIDWYRW